MSEKILSQFWIQMGKTFSNADKKKLIEMVEKYQRSSEKRNNHVNWALIAAQMGDGFTGEQCKRQWDQYTQWLDNRQYTAEEDLLLVRKVRELGENWTKISEFFTHRRPGALKRRYRILQIRELNKKMISIFPDIEPIPELPDPLLITDEKPNPDEKVLCDTYTVEFH